MCSLFQLKRLNRYNNTDQAGSPVVQRNGYRTLWQSLYEVSWLNGLAFPKQLTLILSKLEGPMSSSSTNVLQSPLLSPLSGFCDYEGYVIQKNGIRYKCSRKSVCKIML